VGISGLERSPGLKERFHFHQKRGKLGLKDIPHDPMIGFSMAMDQDVAKRNDPFMLVDLRGRC